MGAEAVQAGGVIITACTVCRLLILAVPLVCPGRRGIITACLVCRLLTLAVPLCCPGRRGNNNCVFGVPTTYTCCTFMLSRQEG